MAEPLTIARPYAKAAFSYAVDSGSVDGWATLLNRLGALCSLSEMAALISHPKLSVEQRADVAVGVLGETPDEAMVNFVRLVARNGRMEVLPEIAVIFGQLRAQREATVQVEVEAAFPVDDTAVEQLKAALSRKLHRTVELQTTIRPELIGGLIIRAGDMVIDGSVRGKLAKLAHTLNS